ncbi:MAG: cupin domain-containing protein [Candidatus Eisenbacteria sp.]|nr:cupin domain-containing protein [Candidatus Eisenbacteria bacterium]
MKVAHNSEIPAAKMDVPGAEKVTIRWLVGEKDDPPNFYMREFEIEQGGCSPRHEHDYEHEVYVLEGEGSVFGGGGEKPLRPGSAVLVQPGEEHQFRNTGDGPLRFLCLVPKDAT